jgi:hypothetical protein
MLLPVVRIASAVERYLGSPGLVVLVEVALPIKVGFGPTHLQRKLFSHARRSPAPFGL